MQSRVREYFLELEEKSYKKHKKGHKCELHAVSSPGFHKAQQ